MRQMPRTHIRHALPAAIAVALAIAAVPASYAQQAASADAPAARAGKQDGAAKDARNSKDAKGTTDLGKVTVSGYRYSIEKSLDQKREANAVVEVITAEDIGKFPDKNVADSLQRVPGVFITRDGGEGSRVSIRGLSPELVLTELNGNYVASSETNNQPTRSFNYVLLPSNMISSVEVFKSAEARIDEGGVGGTVILHTRRPLDMPANTGFATVEGTYADTTRSVDPQVSGLYSWHDKGETFGFLVGATVQKRTTRTMEASTESWRWWADDTQAQPATDVHGRPYANDDAISYWWGRGVYDQSGNHYSGYWVPQSVNFGVRDEDRKRTGTQLTLQLKPSDDLNLTANYFRFDLDGNYTLNMLKIPEWGYSDNPADNGKFLGGLSFDPSRTVATGANFRVPTGGCSLSSPPCTMETPQLSGVYSREKARTQTFDLTAEFHTDFVDGVLKGGRTWSSGGPSLLFRMSAKPRRFTSATEGQNGNTVSDWNLAGTPSMTFSPDIQRNLMAGIAEIDVGSTDSSWQESKQAQNYLQADFSKYFESGWLDSIQAGVKYRKGTAHKNTGNTYWYCPGTQTRYQECDAQAGVAQPGFFLSNPVGNLPGGFDTNTFPGIDYPAYVGYLDGRYGSPVHHEEPNFIYDVDEKIWSGYTQFNFKTERLRGNVGVRVARTRQRVDSTDQLTRQINYYVDGPGGPLSPPTICDGSGQYNYNGAMISCLTGFPVMIPEDSRIFDSYELISQEKTFTDVLPSLNVAYDLTPELVLRGAASKVIARPSYADLGAQQQLTYIDATRAYDRQQFGEREGWSGSGGNKALKPYSAWQYDLGLEWYFQPGSVLGVGLFRKNIDNFIVPLVIDQARTLDGATVTVSPFQTSANGSNAVSKGVEAYAQHTFRSGFGFQANFTYNKTTTTDISLDGQVIGKSPLVGSAKTQANVSVFYENDRFLARASYNRRGTMVGGIVSGLNIYSEPYDQVDLNASYDLMKNFTVTGSVLNLTKSEQRQHLGDDTKARFYDNTYAGRVLYLGLTYKF